MKLTTKTRYGMRAVVDLVLRYNQGPTPVSLIAKKENLSTTYLEQLLNKLKKNGLVKSVRGARGGYVLSRSPDKISVYEVVNVLEGDIAVSCCVSERRTKKRCDRIDKCLTNILWRKMSNNLKETLKGISLRDLCETSGVLKDSDKLSHRYEYAI